MKRIGILGGTFNPIHTGHLAMGQMALEAIDLDEVLFVPSFLPPHKTKKGVVSAKHRLSMVRLAVSGNPKFKVCDYEVKRPQKSYSIDTVRYLIEKNKPKTKFFFIIGRDALQGLKTWREFDKLRKFVTFVVIDRPGFSAKKGPVKYRFVPMPGIDVSSTLLRRRMKQKKSIKYLVPEKVERYITKHKLYR